MAKRICIECRTELCHHASNAVDHLDAQVRAVASLRAENDRLRDDIRQMVEKAADQKLDGYRELGAKCAELEEQADRLREQLREAQEEWHSAYTRAASTQQLYEEMRAELVQKRAELAEAERDVSDELLEKVKNCLLNMWDTWPEPGKGRVLDVANAVVSIMERRAAVRRARQGGSEG